MPRLDYATHAPEATKALAAVSAGLHRVGLEHRLIELVFMRVSQMNGCAFCLDMHARALRQAGETEARLDQLAGWRDSELFTAAERAALLWAEALTRVGETHAPDEAYLPLKQHFDEAGIANLTFAVAVINAWNRVSVGLRAVPGSRG